MASGHKELLAASGRKSPSLFDHVVRNGYYMFTTILAKTADSRLPGLNDRQENSNKMNVWPFFYNLITMLFNEP